MCGIFGFIDLKRSIKHPSATLESACSAISHRGPDDYSYWLNSERTVGLGHRRLSVIDLSESGRQPMVSASGRYTIVFNGEIYNANALRGRVAGFYGGFDWRGHSDTEVLLESIDAFGVDETLKLANGMFGFAIYDSYKKKIQLARDRFGEKPLYYGSVDGVFYFASELKSIAAVCDGLEIDREVIPLYLRHNYVPAPWSIYKGIYKLIPGHKLDLAINDSNFDFRTKISVYWDIKGVIQRSLNAPFIGSAEDAVGALEQHLHQAVSSRLDSDVPLGAFLSGGYDSTAIVAMMSRVADRKVNTFSIGFESEDYDEAQHAAAVARSLGTDHNELYVSAESALNVIPKLPEIYCEPFADSSQIPTYLVSAFARSKVTVALTGDGGDELFGGYNRHAHGPRLWNSASKVPALLRKAMCNGVEMLSPAAIDRLAGWAQVMRPADRRIRMAGYKAHKAARMFKVATSDEMYMDLVSQWPDPLSVFKGKNEAISLLRDPLMKMDHLDFGSRMMFSDTISYLPDDILCKVDRATMATSLEGRVPFLDPELFAFAWTLPADLKVRDGKGKWILKQLVHKHVPHGLMERPKAGFGVPLDSWLRGPLREWAESLLAVDRLKDEQYFDVDVVRACWNNHLNGKQNLAYQLWGVLMFQAWLERNG